MNNSSQMATVLLLSLTLVPVAQAQITPDSTLPNNSQVTPNGSIFQIDGGTTAGPNLFHSFQEFGVPTGKEVFFNNATTIDNILTRVTGGNLSNIDGLIRANGTANLFLINPNGIIFGPNARLDIGGSLISTTADSIKFADGLEYSATQTTTQPLLTISVPIGLQMGSNPGTIDVNGTGHSITSRNTLFAPFDRRNSNPGLQVGADRTFALIGGDVNFNGGAIAANGGRIALGSVNSGTVDLHPVEDGWTFNYENASHFQEIQLSQRSLLDASSVMGGGEIHIQGQTISLTDGSIALIDNRSSEPSGAIRLNASESVLIRGLLPDINIASGLFTETFGSAKGGNIEIETQQLAIAEGGSIATRTFSEAKGGNIVVNSSEVIDVIGFASPRPDIITNLVSSAFETGTAGEINLSTGQLTVSDGGVISASTFGEADSGNVTVNATEAVEVIGKIPGGDSSSVISGSTFNRGQGGSVIINTPQVRVLNGGQIGSSTYDDNGGGSGGSVIINASESVRVIGAQSGFPSEIRADAATLSSETLRRIFDLPIVPDGISGDVVINTPRLTVANGADISVNNIGPNDAGNLQVSANSVFLTRQGSLTASTASGEGGNINLDVRSLQLRRGSFISAEAGGAGNGGNVTISTNTLVALRNSDILANAFQGNGGNIQIETRSLFLSPNSEITASSEFGVDGVVQITNPNVDSTQGLVELPEKPVEAGDRIIAGCASAVENSLVVSGRGGLPTNPERRVIGDRPWVDLRDLSVFRGENTSATVPEPTSVTLVEANGWIVHPDGKIELVASIGSLQSPQLYHFAKCLLH